MCKGMEIGEVRENGMEKLRCRTQRNLAEMRLSSSLRRGRGGGGRREKKPTCHHNSFVTTSSVSSRVCIPAPLLCTHISSTSLNSSDEILSFVFSASYFTSSAPFPSCYSYISLPPIFCCEWHDHRAK